MKIVRHYSLAKRPLHQNLTVEKLTQKFGTINLLSTLSTFLRNNLPGSTIMPSNSDRFDAYKQIVIALPSNQYLGEHILMDRVRTSPSVNASGRALEKAAHFDTAFVVEDLHLYKSEGGMSGILFCFQIYFKSDFILHCRSSRRSSMINIQSSTPARILFSSTSLCRVVHSAWIC